jgi:hypothetical protein
MSYQILSNIEIYRNRTRLVYNLELDERYFDFANTDMGLLTFFSGAIDAPEQIQSGSMKKYDYVGKSQTIHAR